MNKFEGKLKITSSSFKVLQKISTFLLTFVVIFAAFANVYPLPDKSDFGLEESYVVNTSAESLCVDENFDLKCFSQSENFANFQNGSAFSEFLEKLYSVLFPRTRYVAKTEFYVRNILGTSDYITDEMLAEGAKIASSCVEVAEKQFFAEEAIKAGALDIYYEKSPEEITSYVNGMISASKTNADSQAFSVTVTSYVSKEEAYVVMEAVRAAMFDVVKEIEASNGISASDLAIIEEVKGVEDVLTVEPSMIKMAFVGALFGMIILPMIFS